MKIGNGQGKPKQAVYPRDYHSAVLEHAQYGKIYCAGHNHAENSLFLALVLVDEPPVKIVKYRTENQQADPHRLSPGIEKQGKDYQHDIFYLSFRSRKVAYEKQGQEYEQKKYIRKYQRITFLYLN